MKFNLALILIFISSISFGQSRFEPIETVDSATSKVRVVMLSADWCTICSVNESKMEKRKFLESMDLAQIKFFKLEEQYPNTILFNGNSYSYIQTGLNEGFHELVSFFFQNKQPSYPSFIFLNGDNQIVESWSGFIGEAEMESVLFGILNQTEDPDSDKSN